MQVLDQQRLDVTNKTRSNIFGWRGQFTPEFVEYLLDETETGTGLVVDPFCGSGTGTERVRSAQPPSPRIRD